MAEHTPMRCPQCGAPLPELDHVEGMDEPVTCTACGITLPLGEALRAAEAPAAPVSELVERYTVEKAEPDEET